MKIFPFRIPFLFLLLLTGLSSCDVETEFVTGEAVNLRFSLDTLTFDTVFTARGSATRQLKVYNDADQAIMIDRIRVQGETGVSFIFNADGTQGPSAEDVVIWGKDSIFIFVEVEVDPTEPENVSPFIAEDRLVFETGDVQEEVVLLAYGQNAEYINGFNRGQFFRITCDNGIFTLSQDLPTVIYGSLFIDSCIVQALAGSRIYFHGGVQRNDQVGGNGFFNDGFVFTQPNGSLQLLGTMENPVIVRTDRLESEFEDAPAKYRGIILGPGSSNNRFEYAQLLNAVIGLTMDSLAEASVDNSIIAFTGGPAISAYQSTITVSNSVFHSNFGNAIQFVKGGSLTMEHTTVANYGVDASGLVLTNFSCDENNVCIAAPMRARIRNSVIGGSRSSELIFLDIFGGVEPGGFDVRIDNSVVRTDQDFLDSQEGLFADFYGAVCRGCVNITSFSDPLFQDIDADDYQLDSLSVARNLGVFLPALPTDILGVSRSMESPDAGAFERVDQ